MAEVGRAGKRRACPEQVSVVTAVRRAAAAPRAERGLHPQPVQARGWGPLLHWTYLQERSSNPSSICTDVLFACWPSLVPVTCSLPSRGRKHTREITKAIDRDSHLHKCQLTALAWEPG